MMAAIALRIFASLGLSLYGLGGALFYWLIGHGGEAVSHTLMWCGTAWIIAPDDLAKDDYYAWVGDRLKAHTDNA